MPRIVKIVVAVVVTLLCLASMGVLAIRDASTGPEYCNTCHVIQPYYESWASSHWLAHAHAQSAISCQRCHVQSVSTLVSEVVSNLTGSYDTPLAEQKVPKEQCLSCHGRYADLAEWTKDLPRNPHDSHYGKMECRLCHKMHKDSVDYCAPCHGPTITKPGWSVPPPQ